MNNGHTVGIDPGKDTGFAVFSIALREFVHISTMNFWSVHEAMLQMDQSVWPIQEVIIEVPDTKHVWQSSKGGTSAVQRTSVNVGSVLREAALLATGIEKMGYKVTRVNPRGKIAQAKFKQLTGWEGRRMNQHERDAAMMCYRWKREC
ncbi:MAG: hypothetical protein JRJ45_00380 [Deltaproteobacteria bacterium]|nr:hypothetical protein [Deltaproteobacteria bacterium]